jgi:hypothetical protein
MIFGKVALYMNAGWLFDLLEQKVFPPLSPTGCFPTAPGKDFYVLGTGSALKNSSYRIRTLLLVIKFYIRKEYSL